MKTIVLLVMGIIILILPSSSQASWRIPVNVGTVVNSDSVDGGSSISSDGGVLFFHSGRDGGLGGRDIWVSFRESEVWGMPLDLGSVVNTEYDESAPSISWSGDTLYFSSDRPGGEGGYDIWMSVMENGEWGTPVNLGPAVNSTFSESGPEISRDGGRLYFHSDRDGGYGGMDIWCSERVGGSWSEPVNLGTGVNSSSNESNPEVGPLSSTLYFASDRPDGYGNSDLWASFYDGSSWGVALNLGWRVNSTYWDGGPSLSGSGDELYFNSWRSGGNGKSDLYVSSAGPRLLTVEWVARYDGPVGGYDDASDIALGRAGDVYVTGRSYGEGSSSDYATVAYDSEGNERWVARYNGPGNGCDATYAIAVDQAGNVYVTGYSYGYGSYGDCTTIKYDINGGERWVARYNGYGNSSDYGRAIAVDQAGNVYVAGRSTGDGYTYDYTTIKYDADGNELWVALYDGPGDGWDEAYAIALDQAGNVYVTGESEGNGSLYDYATIKYDSDGNELWVARYNGQLNSYDMAEAMVLDQDGNVYVTGVSIEDVSGHDYVTIKYDTNGNTLWMARYDGPGNGYDWVEAIALDQDDNVYVTGTSMNDEGASSFATVAYDSDGNERWVARYNGPESEWHRADAIAVGRAGNVYVTGYSYGGGSDDNYATVVYDTEGNRVWVARYNGPADGLDRSYAIALDQSGNVYVTGESSGNGSDDDYATIKYKVTPPALTIPGR